ncbi:MAG: rhomboid family intramembrane serine protease [Bacteroidetes bacterium]|nr:rhomboid family intramembrane serine protease [Bacteroidota bacterium]
MGIYPRTFSGLAGILAAPLLHSDGLHLASNTLPFIVLGSALYIFYNRIASAVFIQCYFFPSILVWIFGRSSFHIGASGLIYALAFFLMAFGLFQKNFRSLLISLIIIILYGGLFYGILPANPGLSWESHLMGAIVGVATASAYSRVKYSS